jgi:hypothetical protein
VKQKGVERQRMLGLQRDVDIFGTTGVPAKESRLLNFGVRQVDVPQSGFLSPEL